MPLQLLEPITWATLRVRLTLLNTAVVLLVTLAVLAAVRVGMRAALFNELDDTLRGEVREISLALNELHPDLSMLVGELRRKTQSHEERGWFVQLLNGSRSTVWNSDNCPQEVLNEPVDETVVEKVRQLGGYRFARRRITDPNDSPMYVRIGMPTSSLESEVDGVTRLLLPIGLGLALLTPLAGYWLALRATQPLSGILRTAESLKPTRLGDRLKTRGTADELDRLSLTINRLLDEVAGHVERQHQFVADAAHELRGPLAAIQNSLEVASAKNRSPEDYRTTLGDVLDQTRHLSKLANDLLLLAEAEADANVAPSEQADLVAVVRQTVAMFTGVAEERSIELLVRSPAGLNIPGDPRQLRQLTSNLVDNALRFTPAGGSVSLTVERVSAAREACLTVADTGCGIEGRHLRDVFERFFQADAGRDRGDSRRGGGLGLAICRSIAERHGGRIGITSRVGQGTQVTVHLPLESA